MSRARHPMQPIVFNKCGTARFKKNAIVDYLLGGSNLNHICIGVQEGRWSREDYTQLMQLVGYSVAGAGDLELFNRKVLEAADAEVESRLSKRRKR